MSGRNLEDKYTNKLKMTINANWMILLVLIWSETCIHQSMAQTTSTLSQNEGDTVTLSCSLSGTFTFPEWRGPPGLIPYTIQDDASGAISPAAPAASRLEYASNNRDLILSDAVIAESREYKCSYTGLGDHTITLTVSAALIIAAGIVTAALVYKLGTSIPSVVISVFGCGVGAGGYLVNTRKFFCNCFYYWKPKCCDRCVREICDSCKNCNVKGLPFWYRILWLSVIGIPVALGILSVWKAYRIFCENAIRYVLITNDGPSINKDGTWSLGASVGPVCVTKVTGREPAHKKLKVGYQIHSINGETLTGKDQKEIEAMIEDQINVTLRVSSEVAISEASSVELYFKETEPGFKFENQVMVTKVTQGSQADGKLEVGGQIYKINGVTVTGKNQNEIEEMIKQSTKLTSRVPKGGEKEWNFNGKEQLGFEFENQVMVTKVTEDSKVYGKLKVGVQIHAINEATVTGKKQDEIWEMMNVCAKCTLHVSEVGSHEISSVKLKSEQLGIEFENLAMVTNVKKGSKADGKVETGDLILSINGKSTAGKSNAEVNKELEKTPEVLELSIRGNKTIKLNLKGKASAGIEIKKEEGNIVVSAIEPKSAAAISGDIQKGDQILSINGKSTEDISNEDINKWLTPPPEDLELAIRETEIKKVTLHKASLGIKIKKEENDIVVSAIEPQSAAAISGEVQIGDCILSISGISTVDKSMEEVMKQLENPAEVLELAIKRETDPERRKITINRQPGIQIKKEKENIVVSAIEPKLAAAISREVEVGDCILCVNGVSTAGLQVVEIEEMLTFSIILKVTKDVTVLELDPDHNGSIGVKIASAKTVISVTANGLAAREGIKKGDEILKIDGKSTNTMTVKDIAEMIASGEKTVIFKSAKGEVTVEPDTNCSLGLELSSTPNVVYDFEGKAALSRKVKAGDTIVSINGKKTKGKSHQEIKTMLESSGGSISLKLKEAVTENVRKHTSTDNRVSPHNDPGKHQRTSGQGARTNDLEMGELSTEPSSSGRQTLETTNEKQDFMKPLLDDKC